MIGLLACDINYDKWFVCLAWHWSGTEVVYGATSDKEYERVIVTVHSTVLSGEKSVNRNKTLWEIAYNI